MVCDPLTLGALAAAGWVLKKVFGSSDDKKEEDTRREKESTGDPPEYDGEGISGRYSGGGPGSEVG